MATYTENYNLEKPAQSDLYNIDVFNENADKIDEALGSKAANQSLAPIESTSTATRNYSIGQQFVYNGLLYEATAAIASGGTITPGTNCARTTVAEELSALNDSLNKYVAITKSGTTGNAYGELSFTFENRGVVPIVIANSTINNVIVTINTVSTSSCTVIARNAQGELLRNTAITINAIIYYN